MGKLKKSGFFGGIIGALLVFFLVFLALGGYLGVCFGAQWFCKKICNGSECVETYTRGGIMGSRVNQGCVNRCEASCDQHFLAFWKHFE